MTHALCNARLGMSKAKKGGKCYVWSSNKERLFSLFVVSGHISFKALSLTHVYICIFGEMW